MATAFVVTDGLRPARAFATRAAAEAFARAEAMSSRAFTNPLPEYGPPWTRAGLPEGEYRARLRAVGLELPPHTDQSPAWASSVVLPWEAAPAAVSDWAAWWDAAYPHLTAARAAAVWELHDASAAGMVVEVPLEE